LTGDIFYTLEKDQPVLSEGANSAALYCGARGAAPLLF